jgi:hypothetical protein
MTRLAKAWLAPLALALLAGVIATDAKAQSATLLTSTTVYAAVKANGTLAAGNGVSSTQTSGPGNYIVIFNRDISSCAFLGTIGSSATTGTVSTGEITTVGAAIDPTHGVFVTTDDSNGNSAGRPFMLAVYCP